MTRGMDQKPRFRTTEYLWLTVLFFFSVSFLNKGGYILAAMIVFYLTIKLRDMEFVLPGIYLLLFSVLYFLMYWYYWGGDADTVFNYLIAPWGAYLCGEIFLKSSDHPRALSVVVAVLVGGLFLHGLLNLMFGTPVLRDVAGRLAYDFWQKKFISVTVSAMYFSMGMGVGAGLLFAGGRPWSRLLGGFLLGIALLNAINTAHRTTVAIVAVLLGYNLLAYFLSKNVEKQNKQRVAVVLLVCLAITVLAFHFDVGGMYTSLQEEELYRRIVYSENSDSAGRLPIWTSFLENCHLAIFGGEAFPLRYGNKWVHNLWMDAFYKVGFFPFLMLVCATVCIVRQFWAYRSFCKKTGRNREYTVMANLHIAVLMNCMVEPVIDANPYYLISYLMIAGGISGFLSKQAAKENGV